MHKLYLFRIYTTVVNKEMHIFFPYGFCLIEFHTPQPVYVKDDFFDSLSCHAFDNGPRNGRAKFSEQMKVDVEVMIQDSSCFCLLQMALLLLLYKLCQILHGIIYVCAPHFNQLIAKNCVFIFTKLDPSVPSPLLTS